MIFEKLISPITIHFQNSYVFLLLMNLLSIFVRGHPRRQIDVLPSSQTSTTTTASSHTSDWSKRFAHTSMRRRRLVYLLSAELSNARFFLWRTTKESAFLASGGRSGLLGRDVAARIPRFFNHLLRHVSGRHPGRQSFSASSSPTESAHGRNRLYRFLRRLATRSVPASFVSYTIVTALTNRTAFRRKASVTSVSFPLTDRGEILVTLTGWVVRIASSSSVPFTPAPHLGGRSTTARIEVSVARTEPPKRLSVALS